MANFIKITGVGFVEVPANALGASAVASDYVSPTDPELVTFLAAAAEAAKPKEVTMRQARLALLQAGLLDQVETAIAGMVGPTGQAARIEWEYSNSLKRSQPLVTQLAAGLNLTTAQVDALFVAATAL